MTLDARARAWLALNLVDGLGPRRLHALLRALGSPEAILDASVSTLASYTGQEVAEAVRAGPDPARLSESERWLTSTGHCLLAWDDEAYPQQLLSITDPPPVLFAMGRLDLLARPMLAIVGSRNATAQGLETAQALSRALAEAGLTVTSGLALGIDAAAHRGALGTEASSVAVVATGLDRVYPAANRALARDLAERGALISEFAPGTPPLAANFPRRNRLISGLASGVLVVEAALDSGSLITARLGAEQGREVFAVPGSIHSPLSKGCHRLIRDGAKLVETADDVLSELCSSLAARPAPTSDAAPGTRPRIGAEGDGGFPRSPAEASGAAMPDADTARTLDALGFDPATADQVCTRTGLAAPRVRAALTRLELAGCVGALPGGRFQRR